MRISFSALLHKLVFVLCIDLNDPDVSFLKSSLQSEDLP